MIALSVHGQGGMSGYSLILSTDKEVEVCDSNAQYIIKDISVTGNRRTKDATILRELSFDVNESFNLSDFARKFNIAKQQLMNTGLFRNVEVSMRSRNDHEVFVNVDVEERWYFYPLPFVKVVDDKFGKWWNEKNHNLDQLIYGIRLTQGNVTGRNDNLYVTLMNGYTTEVAIEYKGLTLDKDMKWYTNINLGYGKNHEINYGTNYNKQLPVKVNNDYLHTFSRALVDVTYRPAIKVRHTFHAGYLYERIADTVMGLNKSYLPSGTSLLYPELGYTLSYSNLDYNPYPTQGFAGDASIMKLGFSSKLNMWQFVTRASSSWRLSPKDFFNVRAVGMLKLPFEQPYLMQRFIGSGDYFIQGYENYTIDGVAGAYAKATIGHSLINTSIRIPTVRFTNLTSIPLKVYAKAFVNTGYIYNKYSDETLTNVKIDNYLNNKMIYSAGFGLDIVAFTDLIVKLEWSWNQLGQNGLYLHQRERY
ncbi:MAG: POTRA domain-containing protein [Candidatus Dadabacteria bacterium]